MTAHDLSLPDSAPHQGKFEAHSSLYYGRGWRYLWVRLYGEDGVLSPLTLLRAKAEDIVEPDPAGGEAAAVG
jgi:hypothetical protein